MKPKNYGELAEYVSDEIEKHYDKLYYVLVRDELAPAAAVIRRNGSQEGLYEIVMGEIYNQVRTGDGIYNWVEDINEVLIDFDKGRMMIHTTRNK